MLRLCLAILLTIDMAASVARADSVTEIVLAEGMSSRCSTRSFSAAEYAKATATLQAYAKDLSKRGSSYKARAEELKQEMSQLEKCRKQEPFYLKRRWDVSCSNIVKEYYETTAKGSELVGKGEITKEKVQEVQQEFRQLAYKCAQARIDKCIDPMNTKEVWDAVQLFEMAVQMNVIGSYAGNTGLTGMVDRINLQRKQPKFCTETDYGCEVNSEACARIQKRIKDAMDSYTTRFRF